ncbi:hypothetical protein C8Q78DRAFT_989229 [Trametes maxima]|nr:hypothetical protein C8Q78DRAFT_989229 [Trametes maxima]
MPVQLTPAACKDLRSQTDDIDAILTANPVVRVLILEPIPVRDPGAHSDPTHKALVTDGWAFTYIRIAAALSGEIGYGPAQMHVGSAARLTSIVRLDTADPASDNCPVEVSGFDVVYSNVDTPDPDSPPMIAQSLPPAPNGSEGGGEGGPAASSASPAPHPELAVAQLTTQRDKSRRLLEYVLADVSGKLAPGEPLGDILTTLEGLHV